MAGHVNYGKKIFVVVLFLKALHHLRTHSHVIDQVGLNQTHQDRDGEGAGSGREQHSLRPRAFLRMGSTG